MPATLAGPYMVVCSGGAPVSRRSGPWGALRAGDRLRIEERVFTMTGLGHDGPALDDHSVPCWCCFHT